VIIRRYIFLVILLVTSIAYFLSPSDRALPIQTLYQVISIGAALVALYASRIYGFKSANGRAIILIAAGLVVWAIAEIVWYVLQSFMGNNDFPTVTDIFFLLAYPIWGFGIYQGFTTAEVKLVRVRKSLLTLVFSASIILTILVSYFGIYQAYDPNADLLANIVAIFYGLGDLVLIILSLLTILVASEYRGGKLASFWKTMAAGFFVFLVADILFAMYRDQFMADIKPYAYIDLMWLSGYLLIAYAMLENYAHVYLVQKQIRLKLQQRR